MEWQMASWGQAPTFCVDMASCDSVEHSAPMKGPTQDGPLAITRDCDESYQCLKTWVPCVCTATVLLHWNYKCAVNDSSQGHICVMGLDGGLMSHLMMTIHSPYLKKVIYYSPLCSVTQLAFILHTHEMGQNWCNLSGSEWKEPSCGCF